uniref:Uncharacterized protein n=1 Tax=Avena sativa TaxID=4498 RepID=A0ACD5WU19_AVESA
MPAKLLTATGQGGCERLKDMLNKEDATPTAMAVVLMASQNQAATEEKQAAAAVRTINPVLLALACCGDSVGLDHLLNNSRGEVGPTTGQAQEMLGNLAGYSSQHAATYDDVEEGGAGLLAEGVTDEGDTALHAVAAGGDGESFLESAAIIYGKAKYLLFVQNRKGDTPVHCAARARKSEMLSSLIDLAKVSDAAGVKPLLEMENKLKETALHEAVRAGDEDMVERLMKEDTELEKFHQWRKGYSTLASRQNDIGIAPGLTTKLRFAAASLVQLQDEQHRSVCSQLLAANPVALYEPDHRGSFPIHVAASVGATRTVALFLRKYPSSAGLRDAHGRTFLHVAVEKKAVGIVDHASRDTSLRWVLNMRDKDGDTAMHLAVRGGSLRMFCVLFGNRQIHMDLTNGNGETCLDIARCMIPPGMYYTQNSEAHIRRALTMVGARSGTSRQDHFNENYESLHRLRPEEEESRESDNVKDTTRNLSIGSVLIATVTFGATFALPGGYRADDHPDGGSPTLAGSYAFDAFMMANTLAFICSTTATVGFMFSGTSMVNTRSRKFHLGSSVYLMAASVTSLTAAFALGVYMVLAPVASRTAVAMCIVSPSILLWKSVDYWKRWLLLAGPFRARRGLLWTLQATHGENPNRNPLPNPRAAALPPPVRPCSRAPSPSVKPPPQFPPSPCPSLVRAASKREQQQCAMFPGHVQSLLLPPPLAVEKDHLRQSPHPCTSPSPRPYPIRPPLAIPLDVRAATAHHGPG